jgi:hypothetical protein
MHLADNPRSDSLPAAAALLGLPAADLKTSLTENVRGAAALLRSSYGRAFPTDTAPSTNAGRWYIPVSEFIRSENAPARRFFGDSVYTTLRNGVSRVVDGWRITLPPQADVAPQRGQLEIIPNDEMRVVELKRTGQSRSFTPQGKTGLASVSAYHAQAGADSWLYSPNYNAGRSYQLQTVVIHLCEAWSSPCQHELTTAGTGKSAHWMVRSGDGWREQYVHREDRAWHCGFCPLYQPYGNYNEASVGVEHEGYSNSATWYTNIMYRQSAWLTAWTCYLYWFGCDRNHVVGHSEVQQGNSDPGVYWDWNYYMNCVYERYNNIAYGYPLNFCP